MLSYQPNSKSVLSWGFFTGFSSTFWTSHIEHWYFTLFMPNFESQVWGRCVTSYTNYLSKVSHKMCNQAILFSCVSCLAFLENYFVNVQGCEPSTFLCYCRCIGLILRVEGQVSNVGDMPPPPPPHYPMALSVVYIHLTEHTPTIDD